MSKNNWVQLKRNDGSRTHYSGAEIRAPNSVKGIQHYSLILYCCVVLGTKSGSRKESLQKNLNGVRFLIEIMIVKQCQGNRNKYLYEGRPNYEQCEMIS